MGKTKSALCFIAISVLICLALPGRSYGACANGEQTCSNNYGVGTFNFESGGTLDTECSHSYCSKTSLGETGQGLISSGNTYQAYAGINVNREPSLEFTVNATSINLGYLSTTATATATATFSVEAYLAGGYTVETVSQPPQNGSYTMQAPTSPTSSAVGTEQFGINLVANTTGCGAPATYGANPSQVPSASYSYGSAYTGYNTCGKYKYVANSVIASSNSSSGETDYTISYIENISSVTPAGTYSMNQVLVAIPTY